MGQVEPPQPESEAFGLPMWVQLALLADPAQGASVRVSPPPFFQHLEAIRAGVSRCQELVPRRHPEPIAFVPGRQASNLILLSGRVFKLEPMG